MTGSDFDNGTGAPSSPGSRPESRRAEDDAPAASSEEASRRGAAEGGDEGRRRHLVIIGNSPTTQGPVFEPTHGPAGSEADRRVATDMARQLIAETCGDLRMADKIRYCGRRVRRDHAGDVEVVHHPGGYAYTTGLQTCSSVWACPACSYKIRKKRALEVAATIAAHNAAGGSVLYLTLTVSHSKGELLDDVWSIVQDGWAYCRDGGKWTRFSKRHGVAGFVRTLEVTHGPSGWHPHIHVLLFMDGEIDPYEIGGRMGAVGRYFRRQWIGYMADKHQREVSTEVGVDLRLVKADDSDGVGMYCTKAGYEMALADSKIGRADGNRHPFAIARDAATTGDVADVALFREWITSSHGRRSLTWSQGLRKRYGLGPDRTDEELATEEDTGDVIVSVDRELWWRIVTTRCGARAHFLAALDNGTGGLIDAVAYLKSVGIDVVMQHRSDKPPRLAQPKHTNHQTRRTPS